MVLEILTVFCSNLNVSDDRDVFRVPCLGGSRKIEAAGDRDRSIDHDHLIVEDSVFVVRHDVDAGGEEDGGHGIRVRLLAGVYDDLYR